MSRDLSSPLTLPLAFFLPALLSSVHYLPVFCSRNSVSRCSFVAPQQRSFPWPSFSGFHFISPKRCELKSPISSPLIEWNRTEVISDANTAKLFRPNERQMVLCLCFNFNSSSELRNGQCLRLRWGQGINALSANCIQYFCSPFFLFGGIFSLRLFLIAIKMEIEQIQFLAGFVGGYHLHCITFRFATSIYMRKHRTDLFSDEQLVLNDFNAPASEWHDTCTTQTLLPEMLMGIGCSIPNWIKTLWIFCRDMCVRPLRRFHNQIRRSLSSLCQSDFGCSTFSDMHFAKWPWIWFAKFDPWTRLLNMRSLPAAPRTTHTNKLFNGNFQASIASQKCANWKTETSHNSIVCPQDRWLFRSTPQQKHVHLCAAHQSCKCPLFIQNV